VCHNEKGYKKNMEMRKKAGGKKKPGGREDNIIKDYYKASTEEGQKGKTVINAWPQRIQKTITASTSKQELKITRL